MYIMLPEIWGKYAWKLLHIVSIEYPENPSEYDKEIFYDFVTALIRNLPCNNCRNHAREYIFQNPIDESILSSRFGVTKWCIDFHNEVNYRLGKEVLSYQQAMAEIDAMLQKKQQKSRISYISILILIAVIIIIVYVNKKLKF